MSKQNVKSNSELFSMTYGALVVQLLDDFESDDEVNSQLDKIGYNIGLRIVDDFLSKNPSVGKCFDMKEIAAVLALKMYMGFTATVTDWSPAADEFSLVFDGNPLAEFVELPQEKHGNLQYSQALCGAIRGALEMVHFEVKGTDNEIRVRLIKKLDDHLPATED
ncbi:trafficking protein particle complex subunit [Trichuris trichiura]|uniref:Trafficking protein particle complex subunit n=1 Tax=Trichuris trichiura TaxID=36087 RepID=A0A077Z9K9_TRITR|nr:trafficking protein particle complex subunit [Trichuris trichiura]